MSQLIAQDNRLGTAVSAVIGEQANTAATAHLFADYRMRRAERTLQTQRAALQLWVSYLHHVGAAEALLAAATTWANARGQARPFTDYAEKYEVPYPIVCASHYCQHDPHAWHGVTWGLVDGFVKWLLLQGYSIATVNNRLAAIRVYIKLASKAGIVDLDERVRIMDVGSYGATEGKRIDERRDKTRVGHKKADAIVLTLDQAQKLKNSHESTPQGIRDRLLVTLLLDLGIRASEAAGLRTDDIDMTAGLIRVYRQKTNTVDMMRLTSDLTLALSAYQPYRLSGRPLLRRSLKNGKLAPKGMTPRAIGYRVRDLGSAVLAVGELSPHDLRHTWATHAAKTSNPFVLRDAGGWTNMQTPSRYVERTAVVNEGIELKY